MLFRRPKFDILCVSLLLACLLPAAAEGTRYRLVSDSCEIVALLKPAGLGARFSHEHVIHATSVAGELRFDPNDLSDASVEVGIASSELTPDDPELRGKYGLDGELSEGDRETIAENLKGESQLDAGSFPEIRFSADTFEKGDDGWQITGEITIRGVAKSVEVPATIEVSDGILRGECSFSLTQSDFGFSPYSALLGAIKNADKVEVRVRLFAVASEAP